MKANKTLSQSKALLQHFMDADKPCFSINEAEKALHPTTKAAVKELMSDMAKRGLLMRIKKGVYYIIPFGQDPNSFMPNWHLLGECLAQKTDHYIAYYSALQIHNLITQPALNEFIVVKEQIRPSVIKVNDVKFQFIRHNEKHFFGAKKTWIDSFNKVLCSDLEKTFIDCLFSPGHGGGIVEIAKALYAAKTSLNYEKLFNYCITFDSKAVFKRLGYILELLEIDTPIIKELQKIKINSYIILDSELPKEGKRLRRWNIQQNIDVETIKSSILT